jgi:hypothetical protein
MALESRNGMYVEVIANNDTVTLAQDQMLQTEHGSGAINISVGSANDYDLGLRFVVDNSFGVGDVNMNSGAFIIPAGATYQFVVVPDGANKKFERRKPAWLGLGTEDEIQLMLSNAKAIGKTVELADGDIPVTETLTAPLVTGNRIRGKGAMEAILPNHPLRGLGSSLVWQGDRSGSTVSTDSYGSGTPGSRPVGTLLHYQGRELSLEHLAFHGALSAELAPQPPAQPVAKCPLGLLINTTGAGLGTGKLHVRKVVFDYFDTAVQAGTTLNEANCDTSAWYDVHFLRCNTGLKTINLQGMGHTFYNLRVGLTTTAFDFFAGGDLTCYRTFVGSQTTLLKFNNDTPTGFGPNAGQYHFYGLKLDAQAHTSKLVEMEVGNYYADIIFDGLHVGYGVTTDYMFNISNWTTLQINHSKNIREGMFRWNTTSARSLIIVENSRLYGNVTDPAMLFDTANSTGSCRCIVRNCVVDGSNTVLDYDAVLTG